MALDFQALQTEFYARGFSDLNDGSTGAVRAKRWINDAMHLIDEMYDWPYLQTSTTGTMPLTISDLRKVEAVSDVAHLIRLTERSRGELADQFVDLTTTGTATEFYVTGGTTINVYPANTSTTFTVRYWKFGPDLSANGDTPLMPDRFRMAIVDYAVWRASVDRGDVQGAQFAKQQGDDLVARMAESLGILEPPLSFVPLVGDDC